MDIKFKKLHIKNFMSIGEADIDLSDRAFTLIEGVNNNENDNARSNGSGKSSIFEALVWTLTGTTMRGNKDVVNFNFYVQNIMHKTINHHYYSYAYG